MVRSQGGWIHPGWGNIDIRQRQKRRIANRSTCVRSRTRNRHITVVKRCRHRRFRTWNIGRDRRPAGWRNMTRLGTSVNGSGLGILDGITVLVVTSGLSAVMYWLPMSVIGIAAPNLPHKSLPVFTFPVGILLPVWIPFPVPRSYLDLPALVTGLRRWRRTVPHQDGSRQVSDRFPGALGRNPTRRTDRCDIRYGLDQSPYRLPAIIVKLLTDLGKIEQTAEASMWLFTTTASLNQRDFYVETWELNVGILLWLWEPYQLSLENVVWKMRYLP